MHIQLNGELYTLENVQSVAGLLEHLQLAGRRVAVELNFEIVPRSQYESTLLKENDSIEIVHAIGGG
ncbi:sulfur carrier protein ThiS [Denitrificimonas caeni]|uniref:Sulfur carrier protein ThiS n=1 Tax=Denitrificimonas caeni TaxID=521720 RepID=A0AAF0AJX3_9GAMM|nr:sulfur carrier protein ThiS [Denitrificimonas caeni]NLJ11619.1 sulfur carrier protein ThiS [Gammaproteobacteria bacterium]WBE25945.1 sulfur carrier protein ThiS [Denitrificimonas caeni]